MPPALSVESRRATRGHHRRGLRSAPRPAQIARASDAVHRTHRV